MHFKHSSSRLTVAPFTVCPGPILRWLLPPFVAVGFNLPYCDVRQLSVTEERPQVSYVRAVAFDRVFAEPGEMRLFKFLAQLTEPHSFTRRADFEESQRELAFSALPYLLGDLFASGLR